MPSVPVITMAPQNSSHQALILLPNMMKCPACKSGMARSDSPAWTAPATNNSVPRAKMPRFKLCMAKTCLLARRRLSEASK